MSQIEIDTLVKRYGSLDVIHGIDVAIENGEFAVLVGPSGCGKSTLLRMIAGLEEISGGTVSIAGRVVNGLAPKDRDIAMVFQNYALYPHMTVAENMSYALRIKGTPKAERDAAVREAAAILGLDALLERRPSQLSGGQKQRVAMGRAIVRKPAVFLFDEPLSNLDAKLRVKVRAEIKTLHQRLGSTIVYVTHDQIEAMTLADKIIVLEAGRVSQVGSPLELYDRPANLFVATFIGSPEMNILPATVVADGELVLDDGQRVSVQKAGLATGRRIKLGLRPEHLFLAADGDGIRATLNFIEPTGSETLLNCTVGGGELLASVTDRVDFSAGQTVHLAVQPGRAYFFDADSDLAISA